jgi:hypothetical protein
LKSKNGKTSFVKARRDDYEEETTRKETVVAGLKKLGKKRRRSRFFPNGRERTSNYEAAGIKKTVTRPVRLSA